MDDFNQPQTKPNNTVRAGGRPTGVAVAGGLQISLLIFMIDSDSKSNFLHDRMVVRLNWFVETRII